MLADSFDRFVSTFTVFTAVVVVALVAIAGEAEVADEALSRKREQGHRARAVG
jgi:hypothetical protein